MAKTIYCMPSKTVGGVNFFCHAKIFYAAIQVQFITSSIIAAFIVTLNDNLCGYQQTHSTQVVRLLQYDGSLSTHFLIMDIGSLDDIW